eukprot:s3051_g6.t1
MLDADFLVEEETLTVLYQHRPSNEGERNLLQDALHMVAASPRRTDEERVHLSRLAAVLDGNNQDSAKKSGKEEKDAEKKAAREEKKMLQSNEKVAALAAKSVGPLTAAASSISKIMAKAEAHREVIDPGVMTTAEEMLGKLEPWSVAAREAMNRHDANKKGAPDACVPITALPFASDDVKTILKQNTETVKALRAALPKRAPRPKAKAAADKENEAKTANAAEACEADAPKPKRRRIKSQA